MKIGPILGALSPGLSATGLFGGGAQKGGLAALGAMSPLLALLLALRKKNQNGGINVTPNATMPGPLGTTPSGILPSAGIMPPSGPATPGLLPYLQG